MTATTSSIPNILQKLTAVNEQAWLQVGKVSFLSAGSMSETLKDYERALAAYESALRHNPYSVPGLLQLGHLLRQKEQYVQAAEYYQRLLNIEATHGDIWGYLGYCYLMADDLQKAYAAYQQALYQIQNPKDCFLWYGIGMLYERYGTDDHAEEAFLAVLKMDPKFEKVSEIYFRLAHIYKQRQKYDTSLECLKFLLVKPPKPLTEYDIMFQMGHVYETQKDYVKAKEVFEKIVLENPHHSKSIQQLGWLCLNSTPFHNVDMAIAYFKKAVEMDTADSLSWYLLGRCFIAQQKYNKAYEAYQQAVYRDGKNPNFWCSIGVLYFQINQYRDALDAYSRAIHINPYLNEVWWNLGTLYESCNNQITDAIDAYQRAFELDPANSAVKQRLNVLRNAQAMGQNPATAPPPPLDINPNPALTASYSAHAFLGNRIASNYRAPPPKAGPTSSNSTPVNSIGHQQPPSDYSRLKPMMATPTQPRDPYRPSPRPAPSLTPSRQPPRMPIGANPSLPASSPRTAIPASSAHAPLSLQLAVEQELAESESLKNQNRINK